MNIELLKQLKEKLDTKLGKKAAATVIAGMMAFNGAGAMTVNAKTVQNSTVSSSSSKREIIDTDEELYGLAKSLIKELDRNNIVSSVGKKYTMEDAIPLVVCGNINNISVDYYRQKQNEGIIPKTENLLIQESYDMFVAIQSHNQTVMVFNTPDVELNYAIDKYGETKKKVIKNDLGEIEKEILAGGYNVTPYRQGRALNKPLKLNLKKYQTELKEYSKNHKTRTMIQMFNDKIEPEELKKLEKRWGIPMVGRKSYGIDDLCDISEGILNKDDKEKVRASLKLVVDASLDVSKTEETLNELSKFYDGNSKVLPKCDAGTRYFINNNTLAYMRYVGVKADDRTYEYVIEASPSGNLYANFRSLIPLDTTEKEYKQLCNKALNITNDASNITEILADIISKNKGQKVKTK